MPAEKDEFEFNMQTEFSALHIPTFLCGSGFLMLVEQFLSHPYDVVRTRQQVKSIDTWSACSGIYGERKVLGFFTGFLPATIGHMPGAIIYYFSYTVFKDYLQKVHDGYCEGGNRSGRQAIWVSFSAAALADMSAIMFYSPVDVVIQRLFLQSPTKLQYSSWAHVVRLIYKNEGIRGFYKGIVPLAVNTLPATALWWTIYEEFKQRLAVLMKKDNEPNDLPNVVKKDQRANIIAGGLAGFLTTGITNPLDVVRTRMQVASMHEDSLRNHGAIDTIVNIYQKDGLRAFGRGFLPRLVTTSVISSILAFLYEGVIDLSANVKRNPLDLKKTLSFFKSPPSQ